MLRVLGVDCREDTVTDLLLHLWSNLLRGRLLGRLLLTLATERREVATLHRWLVLRVLTIVLTWVVVVLFATTASVVSAFALLSHLAHITFFTVSFRIVQELLHLTPLFLVSLLSSLFGGLPELNLEQTGPKHV